MTTPTNWPNPERPGVPMFPERDGWHILQTYSFPGLFYWDSENQYWFDRSKRYYRTVSEILVDAVETKYISICLTPTQIAELLAGERDRCADKVAAYALRTNHGIVAQRALKDDETGIRNLGAAS